VTSAADYALVVSAGLAGGFINAAAGGGSLVLYPALVGIGLPSVGANVTNSVALWPGYVGNVLGLHRQILDTWPVLRRLLVASILGTLAGAVLLLSTPPDAFDAIVPFLIIMASVLLAVQPRLKQALNTSATERPRVLLVAVALGSVYGGYFGGGLGVILLAVLGLTLGSGIRVANAVKGALAFLVNTVSVLVFLAFGHVSWTIAAAIAPAALLGGVIGARLTTRINEQLLRRSIVIFGLAIGLWLAVKAFA
jgi:uncharacterized membrane protein YfcA